MGYELIGVSISFTIVVSLQLIIISIYLLCHPVLKETQIWPSREIFNGIGEYLKIGLSVVIMLCTEWWIFEILTFMSGLLSIEYTAT